jgi:hypothetical protein
VSQLLDIGDPIEWPPGINVTLRDQCSSWRTLAEPGTMASLGSVFYAHSVIRTRFFDRYLTAAIAAGCSQVVPLSRRPVNRDPIPRPNGCSVRIGSHMPIASVGIPIRRSALLRALRDPGRPHAP